MSAVLNSHSTPLIWLHPQPSPRKVDSILQHLQALPRCVVPTGYKLNSSLATEPHVRLATLRVCGWLGSIGAHLLVVYLMLMFSHQPQPVMPATPMMVSLILPPEAKPTPELVPIVEPIQLQKKPVIKPKKVVKNIVPVESPVQPVFEATATPVEQVESVVEASAPAAAQVQDAPKMAPVIEEKIEPPKFGVAYQNNPPPDYPRMAKRAGEEGRVVLRVLVSAEGGADNVLVERSSGFDRLDRAAVDAVWQWRFVPARKGGQALSAYVLVPLRFSLTD